MIGSYLFACYIVLNEGEYIYSSLASIYNSVNHIVIIEGSTDYSINFDHNGCSIDNTKEEIERFIKDFDKEHKINYIRIGKVKSKTDLRNAYLCGVNKFCKLFNSFSNTWCLIVDGDELYKLSDLIKLKEIISKFPQISYFYNPQYWFWKDFNHFCYIDKKNALNFADEKKWLKFEDTLGNIYCQGLFHERIFKYQEGMHYRNHATITDGDGYDLYIHPLYTDKRLFINIPRYHYGYIKSFDKIFDRFRYYTERDNSFERNNPKIKDIINNMHYMLYLKKDYNNFKLLYPYLNIIEFKGTHPEELKYCNLYKNNFVLEV